MLMTRLTMSENLRLLLQILFQTHNETSWEQVCVISIRLLFDHDIINHNGAFFSLKSQEIDGEKQVIANVQSCSGTSQADIRNWYNILATRAAAHSFYEHPYFCY